jgi:FKBP-type peptidyl-prolyl cis-trans isomerase
MSAAVAAHGAPPIACKASSPMLMFRLLCGALLLSLCACTDSTDTDSGEAGSQESSSAATADKAAKPAVPGALPAPADVAKAPDDATVTGSGLAYKVLQAGTGTERPTATDKVTVHYTGWTSDGRMFDSSVVRGKTTSFPLNRVIKGWTEGLQLMVIGEKTRFWIPGNLAYGDTPRSPGAPSGTLVFDIELFSFEAAQPIRKAPAMTAIPAPPDVNSAPADATVTGSGLAYKVLTPGDGTAHPTATDKVTVHYTGWTTDGKMFDSSVSRGQTISFPLNGVIAGWTEGLQLMVTGEKARFWIPGNLAYGDTPQRPGAPAGTLVFDVELFSFN